MLSNTTKDWPKDMFTLDFLNDHCGSMFRLMQTAVYSLIQLEVEMENSPRDNHTLLDMTGWTVGQYISYLQQPGKRTPERLYGKDMPCPDEWYQHNNAVSLRRTFTLHLGRISLLQGCTHFLFIVATMTSLKTSHKKS